MTTIPTTDQRIRAVYYGLAVCDALGGPLEFGPRHHGPSTYLRNMKPNHSFNLPAGHWTDDTSMALCLATSLSACKGRHNAIDQAELYVKWIDRGCMSSVPGHTFDFGIQTRDALSYWRYPPFDETQTIVAEKFKEEICCGNGSLMRCLPCGLIAENENDACELGRLSSLVTRPHARCQDACSMYCLLVFNALQGATKEQLLRKLMDFLMKDGIDGDLKARLEGYTSIHGFATKPRADVSSSGYVLDSLEAAFWAFFRTEIFEQGAIEVVNLGNDADTVGAIYGGLAGAFYRSVNFIPAR